MCTGAEVAALAGTGAQMYGQQQTQRDQQRAVQQRADEARQLNERAGARVSQEVDKLKTSSADQGNAAKNELQNDFMAALRRSQLAGGGAGLDNTPGAVSDQYSADAATARRTNAAGNRTAASNAAAIDAPFLQRAREAAGNSRLQTDLSRIDNQGRGQDFLAQLRASLVSGNSGMEAAGQLLNGWGQARSQRAPPGSATPGDGIWADNRQRVHDTRLFGLGGGTVGDIQGNA